MDNGIPVITVTDKEIVVKQIPGVDIDTKALNEALLTLPAKTYLGLYHKMQEKVVGYSYFGACCAPISEEETE